MKYKAVALFLCGILLLLFTSCTGLFSGDQDRDPSGGSEAPDEITKTVTYPVDVMGVTILEKPRRVVSLSPALSEMALDIGLMDTLIGVSDYCNYPQRTEFLEPCGTAQLPDFYKLRELAPDVVITSTPLIEADLILLQQMGAETIVFPRANSLDELDRLYLDLCALLLGQDPGQEWYEQNYLPTRKSFDKTAKIAAEEARENPASAIYLKMLDFNMATGDTLEGELLEAIGLKNDAGAYSGWIYPKSEAIALMPDIIFYDRGNVSKEALAKLVTYNTTPAMKQNRTMPVDGAIIERQGKRMLTLFEEMAKFAYPDAFAPEPEPEVETEE